jgi:chemotaxis protein CheZ
MPSATVRAVRSPKLVSNGTTAPKAAGTESDIQLIVHELAAVADYIGHMKQEIAALRPNELCRDRIPSANDELGNVVRATASATHTIMAAAEEILAAGDISAEAYRTFVATRVLAIFEACSFQDITGQRIAKVHEALGHLERRLDRFARAVNVRDSADATDPEEALRQARREMLLLNGPQSEDMATKQDDIDALFK